jgi:hypothetical protein
MTITRMATSYQNRGYAASHDDRGMSRRRDRLGRLRARARDRGHVRRARGQRGRPPPRLGAEVIFGMPDQTLRLRHDAGSSAVPYVDGALIAIRKVSGLVGVHRGLDVVLDL